MRTIRSNSLKRQMFKSSEFSFGVPSASQVVETYYSVEYKYPVDISHSNLKA